MLLLIAPVILNAGNICAQWLISKPECISYDLLNNRYLVSCFYAGSIVAVDSNGNQSTFKSGLGYAYSNTISGNAVYVSTVKTVKGFDLNSGAQVLSVYIPTSHQLDGMTTDTAGNLYVVDFHYNGTSDQIFKININTQTYTTFVPAGAGLVHMPQDLFFDKPNNRLIVVSATVGGPIQAVNLSDSSISNILGATSGSFDGIEMDTIGNYYLSNWTLKTVIKYDHYFANPPVIIFSNQKEPSNLGYNRKKHVLAIPFFNADTVVYLNLGTTGIVNMTNETANEYALFQNYPNPFNPVTNIKFRLKNAGFVTLKVYNILGKEIATLINEKLKSGVHEVRFPNDRVVTLQIPSGVYLYKITAGNFNEVKKMILLK
ncbi:MAG: T9SS type A sorting domain-containing protein [Ignavibacteria bacterium]|nr:T9SS type A sorting domain-containing protein [Ignavibacteria bacterium]